MPEAFVLFLIIQGGLIMKFKLFASVCVAAGLAFGLAGCGDDNAPKSGDAKTLTVGASPVRTRTF